METLFWCICTLALGILLGVLIEIDIKIYNRIAKQQKDLEVKKARTTLMKIRDRQCTSVNNKCNRCDYNTEFGCLANSALKYVINIECVNAPDDEIDSETLDDEAYEAEDFNSEENL